MDRLLAKFSRRRRFRGPRLPAKPLKLTLSEGATRQVDAAIDA
jgi:hypothetical protein